MSPEDIIGVDCDILLPSALENAITLANVGQVKAKIIAELANGPTTPGADRVLARPGVFLVPDILANAGGVTVSYYEWVQDQYSFFWSEKQINETLEQTMQHGIQLGARNGATLRHGHANRRLHSGSRPRGGSDEGERDISVRRRACGLCTLS